MALILLRAKILPNSANAIKITSTNHLLIQSKLSQKISLRNSHTIIPKSSKTNPKAFTKQPSALQIVFNPIRQLSTESSPATPTPEPIPRPALYLGYAGLIPFFATAAATSYYANLTPPHLPAAGHSLFLQMTYAATVLSFLGAAHWGLAMANYNNSDSALSPANQMARYSWGVVPQLLAWISMTQHPTYGMGMLMAGFSGAFIADMIAATKGMVPSWFIRLRLPLTMGALASLGVTFVQML